MPVREHHTVTIEPARILWVVFQVTGVQRGGNFCHAQWNALVAFLCFDDGVNREKTDGVRQILLGMCVHGADFCQAHT